jgi:peroxiredoxin
MRFAALVALSTMLVACPSGGGASKGSNHPLARKAAPEFEAKIAKGGTFKPKDANGHVLVLDFWATWCVPCKASFPKIDAMYRKKKDQGLEVFGINEDEDTKGVDAFVKETNASFPIVLDEGGKAAEKYGVETMPSSFVIDRRGVVRYVHSGYHPEDAPVIEKEVDELLAESP